MALYNCNSWRLQAGRLNNTSATVNIPVFIEQRNILLQKDISFVVVQNDI